MTITPATDAARATPPGNSGPPDSSGDGPDAGGQKSATVRPRDRLGQVASPMRATGATGTAVDSATAFVRIAFFATLFWLPSICFSAHASAQKMPQTFPPGTSEDEREIWLWLGKDKPAKARALTEKILEKRPNALVARYGIAYIQHYAEANFPMALFHAKKALELFEKRYEIERDVMADPVLMEFYAMLLREMESIYADLERYEDQLNAIKDFNRFMVKTGNSDARIIAERAWPLMKLRRFADARQAAQDGIDEGSVRQTFFARNAFCAIEFEAGNDEESYVRCKEALEMSRMLGMVSAVDLSNFAEASRSLFKLDEAETFLKEATTANASWYGNPWLELADLYMRQGRYLAALEALKEIPDYKKSRPAHVRDADRAEHWRVLSQFFLLIGKPSHALRITDRALRAPDRREHNSRDAEQDEAIIALLDRRARRLEIARSHNRVAAAPWYRRLWAHAESIPLRVDAWLSGRKARKLLGDERRLVGSFRIGTSRAAVVPAWLVGDLVEVMGPSVVLRALKKARKDDSRALAPAYFDAFECEVNMHDEAYDRAISKCTRAIEALPTGEALLRSRAVALRGHAYFENAQYQLARADFEGALLSDPGIFSRLELPLPVRFRTESGSYGELESALGRLSNIDEHEQGLIISFSNDQGYGQACLLSKSASIGCLTLGKRTNEDADVFTQRMVSHFSNKMFSPRVNLSHAAANGLDGSNEVDRNRFGDLFE